MPSFSRLNREQLNTLAKELGIDPDDFERADDLRTFINSNTNDDDLNTAMMLFEEEDTEAAGVPGTPNAVGDVNPAALEEREDVDAAGADIGVASTAGLGNDEAFATAPEDEPQERREVTNPEGESVFVTVLGETDEGTVVREDGTMRRFTLKPEDRF